MYQPNPYQSTSCSADDSDGRLIALKMTGIPILVSTTLTSHQMDRNTQRKKRLFEAICKGQDTLSENNALQFLEGFYSQGDVVSCIDKVITTDAGLSSLQSAMRAKLLPQFF